MLGSGRGLTLLPGRIDAPALPSLTGTLLDTKLYPPRWRPDAVARARLRERLDRGARGPLTLVSAPAGFGKTTLLTGWLAASPATGRSVAWLSLDSSDNHPASFWTYLVAALQTVQPGIGLGMTAFLQSPRPGPIEGLLPGLLNELGTSSRDIVLVLDDYHLIHERAIHEGLEFLIDHLPPPMHLIVGGRSDPPLPLARLRARGELVEIRAADLRFTRDEAAAFLNDGMGLELSAQHVAVLDVRTEGWIAGLQLAGLSLQGREDVEGFISAFTGDDRYIVDYLIEEVLERQPEDVRRFLLRTSILERLSGTLCDAVTAAEGGKGMLERLERGNLFVVPLDDRRQWYRYHQLFADVLQAHLIEEQPDALSSLHLRASVWFEENGQPAAAIRHALAADDVMRAAGLVECEAEVVVRQHQPDRLIEWLKSIPDDLVRSMPVLSTYYALALQGLGQVGAAESRVSDAERWLQTATDVPAQLADMLVVDQAGFRSLPARVALARGYQAMAAGDVAGTVAAAVRALEELPADEHHWRGAAASLVALAYWAGGDLEAADRSHKEGVASLERAGDIVLAIGAAYHGGTILRELGRLSEARAEYERSIQLATRVGGAATPGMANLHFGLSELHCERGDLEAAALHLQHGEDLGNSAAVPATPYRRLLARARLRRTQGDVDAALDLLDQAEPLYLPGAVPQIRPLGAMRARLWIASGRLAEASAWADAQGLSVNDDAEYLLEFRHVTLALLLIARSSTGGDDHSLREIDGFLARLLSGAEAGARTGAVIEISVLQAIVRRELDGNPSALAHLERALTLAEPEGYLRVFVDQGEPVRELLRQAVAAGSTSTYAKRVLAEFGDQPDPEGALSPSGIAALTDPLTPRELEILRLIAAGMTNQGIADQLVISMFTVKRHLANAYGKLDVGHRTEAVARMRAIGLL